MNSPETIFPLAYGNEEEISLLISTADSPVKIAGTEDTVICNLPDGIENSESFLSNGSRLYWDSEHLESATPECANIDELVLRIHASEALLTQALCIKEPSTKSLLQFNRRVIDTEGNSWGMHDNFGFMDAAEKFTHAEDLSVVLGHLATRSFVTGAGLVATNGYRYGQKSNVVHHDITGYSYAPYMLRLASNSLGVGDRVEIRCGDINLSDWATRMRVGSTALALAIQQTKLAKNIPPIGSEPLKQLNACNILHLQEDGAIRRTPWIITALDYQRRLADTGLALTSKKYDVPQELQTVAEELAIYCDDFDSILKQEATIHSLTKRAEWADKFATILRGYQKDRKKDGVRIPYDTKAKAQDILYDQINIKTERSERTVSYGWGYALQRDKYGHRPSPVELQKAIFIPPDTRARMRAGLVREGYNVTEWDCVEIDGDMYHFPNPLTDQVA